jgi:hypothetical protein
MGKQTHEMPELYENYHPHEDREANGCGDDIGALTP